MLSGSGSPYSFTQQFDGTSSAWAAAPRTGTAYEANGVSGLANKVARLYPDRHGAYRFQWVASGGGSYGTLCGCATAPLSINCAAVAGSSNPAGLPALTYTYQARPAILAGNPYAPPAMGWYGTNQPVTSVNWYWLSCYGSGFWVYNGSIGTTYAYYPFAYGNTCSPFLMPYYAYGVGAASSPPTETGAPLSP